ncbi:peptidase P60 [Bacillus sp. V5-8f]|nr:peptidase P60 [Bacillus sp. V5-8f]
MKKAIAALSLAVMFGSVSPMMGEAATYHTKAISVAKTNLGVPYKWGGTTPNGFDCSGLIQYSFGKAGKSLPRTSADMYKKGTRIMHYTSLKPGDLVFFAPNRASRPTHASIYMGSNKMIHSSSSKGVSTTSIYNTYWKPQFIGAKRI